MDQTLCGSNVDTARQHLQENYEFGWTKGTLEVKFSLFDIVSKLLLANVRQHPLYTYGCRVKERLLVVLRMSMCTRIYVFFAMEVRISDTHSHGSAFMKTLCKVA